MCDVILVKRKILLKKLISFHYTHVLTGVRKKIKRIVAEQPDKQIRQTRILIL